MRNTRIDRVAVAVGVIAGALALLQLFVPSPIGMADNGDGLRMLCHLDAQPTVAEGQEPLRDHVVLRYHHGEASPGYDCSYQSTAMVPMRAAAWISSNVLPGHPTLDIRLLGAFYSVAFGLAMGLLAWGLPGGRWARLGVSGVALLLLGDSAFTAPFTSVFNDPLAFVCLIATFGLILRAWRADTVSPWLVVGIGATSAVMVGAKPQYAPLAGVITVVLLVRTVPVGRLRGRWLGRVVPLVVALVVLTSGYLAVRWRPPDFKRINSYHALFFELLGHSPNVKADLKELGLPASLARYAGSDGYTKVTALNDPGIDDVLAKAGPVQLAEFYARHPDRARRLFSRGIVAMSDPVIHYLGNYPYAPGEEAATTCRFCLASNASRGTRDYAQWVFSALWIGEIAVAAGGLRRRDRDTRAVAGALVVALAVTAVSLGTALLGDGDYELIKHLYLTDAANFLALTLTVATGVQLWATRIRRPAEPGSDEDPQPPGEPLELDPADPFVQLMVSDPA